LRPHNLIFGSFEFLSFSLFLLCSSTSVRVHIVVRAEGRTDSYVAKTIRHKNCPTYSYMTHGDTRKRITVGSLVRLNLDHIKLRPAPPPSSSGLCSASAMSLPFAARIPATVCLPTRLISSSRSMPRCTCDGVFAIHRYVHSKLDTPSKYTGIFIRFPCSSVL
jgi:hypothetical protein